MSDISPSPNKTPIKDKRTELKLPSDLHDKATQKAEQFGWGLSAVIRALLEAWIDRDVILPSDVGNAAKRAPKVKRSQKTKRFAKSKNTAKGKQNRRIPVPSDNLPID